MIQNNTTEDYIDKKKNQKCIQYRECMREKFVSIAVYYNVNCKVVCVK